jgi:hypothetical protein
MTADQTYHGEEGGLYGDGHNTPPEAHRKAALERAAQIQPLDAEGRPSAEGKIVLLIHGMSNTTIEAKQFIQAANADSRKNPAVLLVDGAQSGMDTMKWTSRQPERPGRDPWEVLDRRVDAAGATPQQVQVVWMKHAIIMKTTERVEQFGQFPKYSRQLQNDLAEIARLLKARYPNLKLAYVSDRTYGGYGETALNPEPCSYESGFGVRWLIQDQITGVESLSYAAEKAPLLLWGPYLWADGEKGRKSDGLVYRREDYRDDGTHVSELGRQKVAEQLLTFFSTDPTARGWFVKH